MLPRLKENVLLNFEFQNEATRANRPFYICVLSYLAMNASKAGDDLFDTDLSAFFM